MVSSLSNSMNSLNLIHFSRIALTLMSLILLTSNPFFALVQASASFNSFNKHTSPTNFLRWIFKKQDHIFWRWCPPCHIMDWHLLDHVFHSILSKIELEW